MNAIDPTRCPRCGQSNDCAQASASGGHCWCFGQSIDPALIRSLPAAAQGKACLCRKCAGGPSPAPPPATPVRP